MTMITKALVWNDYFCELEEWHVDKKWGVKVYGVEYNGLWSRAAMGGTIEYWLQYRQFQPLYLYRS